MVARGAAYADFDNDGDLDVLINVNNGPARLLRNDGGNRGNVVRGPDDRDGLESRRHRRARRRHRRAADGKAWQIVKTGSSFASQSELPLTFGLGAAPASMPSVSPGRAGGWIPSARPTGEPDRSTIEEGKGLVRATPIAIKTLESDRHA